MSVRSRPVAVAALALFATLVARPVAAHVDYVTEDTGDPIDAVTFTVEVLSEPLNAAVFAGSGLVAIAGLAAYLWVRPTITDVVILREKLVGYGDLVPWMLRLAIGLPRRRRVSGIPLRADARVRHRIEPGPPSTVHRDRFLHPSSGSRRGSPRQLD